MIDAGGGVVSLVLLPDSVGADAIGPFEGFDGEAHLLAQAAGDEAADAVSLPVGSGHDVGERGAVRALEQVEDDGLLAAVARRGRRVLGSGLLGRLGLLRRNGGRLGRGGWASVPGWPSRSGLTAVLRSVNFLTGLRSPKGGAPAKAFQTSTNRVMGQSAESLVSSFSVANATTLSCAAGARVVGSDVVVGV